MSDYWIKLYHEIIDDPKMAVLPDRLWRRFIELCLLAGRLNGEEKSGILPDTRQLAWVLRVETDDLQLDMDQLSATGMIENITGGWLIKNFSKRQRALTSTERSKMRRERQRKRQYYGDATRAQRNVRQNHKHNITESESEQNQNHKEDEDDFTEMRNLFETLTGLQILQGDVETIIDCADAGVIEDDIRAALQWRIDQGLKPAKTISALGGGVMTNRAMRIQTNSARPSSNGRGGKSTGAVARKIEQLKAEGKWHE